jgi:hypothetical protein
VLVVLLAYEGCAAPAADMRNAAEHRHTNTSQSPSLPQRYRPLQASDAASRDAQLARKRAGGAGFCRYGRSGSFLIADSRRRAPQMSAAGWTPALKEAGCLSLVGISRIYEERLTRQTMFIARSLRAELSAPSQSAGAPTWRRR